MTVKMGPILGFSGVKPGAKHDCWQVSARIVWDGGGDPPEIACSDAAEVVGAPTGKVIHEHKGSRVVRYDLSVRQAGDKQEIDYRIDDRDHAFWVPPKGSLPRVAYASCNGFSDPRAMKKVKDKNDRWTHMAGEHGRTPINLLLLGGDQVYSDGVWELVPRIKKWAELPLNARNGAPFGPAMDGAVRNFYFNLYCERWNQPEPAKMFASIPSLMMWDDHDIFDGWGSYDDEQNESQVFQGIFAAARDHFRVFQLGIGRDEPPPGMILGQPAFNYAHVVGPVAILALDMRYERKANQVITRNTWDAIYRRLRELNHDNIKHLLVLSSIPVVHPDFAAIEKVLGWLPGRQELEDDLRDHWRSPAHKGERLRLIHRLLDFAGRTSTRVTILSGDVHVGAVGVIESRRSPARGRHANVINQLTSSAIVHPVPPGLMLFALNHLMDADEDVDRDIVARMSALPGHSHRFIGGRNWLSLEMDDDQDKDEDQQGRIWANWHVEDNDEPYCKVIHPIQVDSKIPLGARAGMTVSP